MMSVCNYVTLQNTHIRVLRLLAVCTSTALARHFHGTFMARPWTFNCTSTAHPGNFHGKKNGIGAYILIGREIQCLPYVGFFYYGCCISMAILFLWMLYFSGYGISLDAVFLWLLLAFGCCTSLVAIVIWLLYFFCCCIFLVAVFLSLYSSS